MSAPIGKWTDEGGALALWDEADVVVLGWMYVSPPDQTERWGIGCMACIWFDLSYGEAQSKAKVERHVVTHIPAVVP